MIRSHKNKQVRAHTISPVFAIYTSALHEKAQRVSAYIQTTINARCDLRNND